MGLLDNPFEAGLGFCVHRDKWPALSSEVSRQLRTLAVGGQEYVAIYGGEAGLREGRRGGRPRRPPDGLTGSQKPADPYLPGQLGARGHVGGERLSPADPATCVPDQDRG